MVAKNVFIKMMPVLLIIVGLVGLLLGFVPPETIEQYLWDKQVWAALFQRQS